MYAAYNVKEPVHYSFNEEYTMYIIILLHKKVSLYTLGTLYNMNCMSVVRWFEVESIHQ